MDRVQQAKQKYSQVDAILMENFNRIKCIVKVANVS